jgi:hypothetical protein
MHSHINSTTEIIVRALTERKALETATHAPANRTGTDTQSP